MNVERYGRDNGIYLDLPESAYFANDRLSSSGAKLVLSDPPRFEHEIIKGNKPADKPAYVHGKAVHVAVLEPDKFGSRYLVADCKTRTAKAYKDLNSANPLHVVLPEPEHDRVVASAKAVRECPLVRDCGGLDLLSGQSEVTVYTEWNDVPIKARLDNWLEDSSVIVDLKTCASASPEAFGRDIWRYRYPLSMGWYLRAVFLQTGHLPRRWFWVAVESQPPHSVAVYEASSRTIQIGIMQAEHALREYKSRSMNNDWQYSREAIPVDPPAWVDSATETEDMKHVDF